MCNGLSWSIITFKWNEILLSIKIKCSLTTIIWNRHVHIQSCNTLDKSAQKIPLHAWLGINFTTAVHPESIDWFPMFLPLGLHASLTWYSYSQPCIFLCKSEDGIGPAVAAFGWFITSVIKHPVQIAFCFLFRCDKACLNAQSWISAFSSQSTEPIINVRYKIENLVAMLYMYHFH